VCGTLTLLEEGKLKSDERGGKTTGHKARVREGRGDKSNLGEEGGSFLPPPSYSHL